MGLRPHNINPDYPMSIEGIGKLRRCPLCYWTRHDMGMLIHIFVAATRVFLLALQIVLAATWVLLVILGGLVHRIMHRFPEDRTRQLTDSIQGMQEINSTRCQQCHTLNDETDLVCFRCGELLPARRNSHQDISMRLTPWLWVAILVILIVSAIAIA